MAYPDDSTPGVATLIIGNPGRRAQVAADKFED